MGDTLLRDGELLTISTLARRYRVHRQRVVRAVNRLGIEPVRRAGWTCLYDQSVVIPIAEELERTRQRWNGRTANALLHPIPRSAFSREDSGDAAI
jgi:hypothetical protein